MSPVAIREVLLWCAIINYGLLVVWGVLFLLPHGWLYRLNARLSRLSPEQLDTVNYAGMVFYKVSIILFNLAPYIALTIVG